jgi:hypothetical protein
MVLFPIFRKNGRETAGNALTLVVVFVKSHHSLSFMGTSLRIFTKLNTYTTTWIMY